MKSHAISHEDEMEANSGKGDGGIDAVSGVPKESFFPHIFNEGCLHAVLEKNDDIADSQEVWYTQKRFARKNRAHGNVVQDKRNNGNSTDTKSKPRYESFRVHKTIDQKDDGNKKVIKGKCEHRLVSVSFYDGWGRP